MRTALVKSVMVLFAPRLCCLLVSCTHQAAACHAQVDGLRHGREYLFRVRASNARGPGPWSEQASAETQAAAPEAPAPVTFGQRTATSVRVRWEAPREDHGAPVLRYRSAAGTLIVQPGSDVVPWICCSACGVCVSGLPSHFSARCLRYQPLTSRGMHLATHCSIDSLGIISMVVPTHSESLRCGADCMALLMGESCSAATLEQQPVSRCQTLPQGRNAASRCRPAT